MSYHGYKFDLTLTDRPGSEFPSCLGDDVQRTGLICYLHEVSMAKLGTQMNQPKDRQWWRTHADSEEGITMEEEISSEVKPQSGRYSLYLLHSCRD